ncbi:protein FAM111A-like [Thamnophis elegans]|uniref:protein FAM111A-like n=1 Tax=Thamnophis elegans TaxID=35005 RepID=UPI001376C121|nr:protein FAM111A-like [Thamnophis elegans]XP_032084270.1 protein FAM111A-like [Thamnophis elegans]
MDQLKDDPIAGTSDEKPKIKEEVNNEYDFPEKNPTSCKDASEEKRTFLVTLNRDERKHEVRGRLTDSLISALKSSTYICDWMERKKGVEFHLIEKKEPWNVCVNMGMPLKYVPDRSQFELKSYNATNERWYRQYDDVKDECIVFCVHKIVSRMKSRRAQRIRLIKNRDLLKEYCILCICAPKGESIKDAMCNDGRFLPFLKEENWTLEDGATIIDNNFPVDNLSGQVYNIGVEPKPEPDCEMGQVSAKRQKLQDSELGVLHLYPKLKEERENIAKFLRYKKDKLEAYKRNYGKEMNGSLSCKLVRILAKNMDSVGFIGRRISGYFQWVGTCFVLHGRYILTCHHVIRKIVGEGIEAKDWGNRIKQLARVTFSYEELHRMETWFSLENWFEIADEDLDFAVLKLEENGSNSHPPPGLLHLNSPPPPNGPIFIIGHPKAGVKSIDVCLVVSVPERDKAIGDHLQKCLKIEHCICVCGYRPEKSIHRYNPEYFVLDTSNANVVTYDACFFEGSSGSPVFNKHGQLVALHAAGLAYEMKDKDCSIIEWGYSIDSIILKIKSTFKSWHDAIIAPDAREDSSHVDAFVSEAGEEMNCH